jgi:uncharacterized protein YndB with AHSA1/START domain
MRRDPVMRSPAGTDYPGGGVYREIVAPERLVFTNRAEDVDGNIILDGLTTVTFTEHNGKTKLTLHTRMTGLAAGTELMLNGMEAGWTQSLESLEELIAAENRTAVTRPSDRELLFTRLFDAPRELVFIVWTDPGHLAQWWGPRGFTTSTVEMDARPGGAWRLIMHGPDGVNYKSRIVYLEVVKPERLVYKHAGEEKDEAVRFTVTVTFEEAGGKTRLNMRMVFESAAEREHVTTRYGAEKGATETLERLQEHLATIA